MRRILQVAKREFVESVRTKIFILNVLMLPVIIVAIVFFANKVADSKPVERPAKRIVIRDESGELIDDLQEVWGEYNEHNEQRRIEVAGWIGSEVAEDGTTIGGIEKAVETYKEQVRKKQLDLLVIIEAGVVGGEGTVELYSAGVKAGDYDFVPTVQHLVRQTIRQARYEREGLDGAQVARLQHVPMQEYDISEATGPRVKKASEKMTQMMVPFFFMYMMFMGIFGMGQHMINSIIEEKQSRIIEVLLAALRPTELMAGKILGLSGIGLLVIGLWTGAALGAAKARGLNVAIEPVMAGYFLVYFIFGFVLISSIFAGLGSVCTTPKEAQSMMMPLSMLFVLPLVGWFHIASQPNGMIARVLSYVPPVTPMVMVARLSAGSHIAVGEIAATIALLVVAVPLAIWAGAKLFRTGVLMTGKRPSFKEIVRWLRAA